eukprot:gene10107-11142_t
MAGCCQPGICSQIRFFFVASLLGISLTFIMGCYYPGADIKTVIGAYLIAVNLLTLFTFWLDKVLAIEREWRVAEMALYVLNFLGGPIGALLAEDSFSACYAYQRSLQDNNRNGTNSTKPIRGLPDSQKTVYVVATGYQDNSSIVFLEKLPLAIVMKENASLEAEECAIVLTIKRASKLK